jgi:L-ascorbate metabolism protein UlaG (beta-lactamase superfamily)
MIITYYGNQSFKVAQGDLTLAFNPVSKDSNIKPARYGADIVLTTINHPDFNGSEQMEFGERKPFVVRGPGDYEVKDIRIHGTMTKAMIDKKESINTIYSLIFDGISICYLGALTESPKAEVRGEIIEPDILFVPVGGAFLSPPEAYKLAVSFEPHIIIPMAESAEALKAFIKEGGEGKPETVDKLVLKKKDVIARNGDIIVFEAVNG